MKSNRNDILDCLNKIQKINKNNPSAFYYLGKISQDEEKYEKAIDLYIQSLEHHYKNIVEIYENLGICYQKINEYKEALIYYEKYSIYIPKDVIYYKMGLCSLELKLYNKANEYFTMCVTLNNNNVEAINYKGICYVNLGNEKKAERNFLKAIEIDCNFHKAYLNLIKLYILKRKYDDAQNILNLAFKRAKLENDSEEKDMYISDLKQFEQIIKKEREEFEQKKDCSCQGCNIY
jgi:tetratricopeptide (TPR) repeat protein